MSSAASISSIAQPKCCLQCRLPESLSNSSSSLLSSELSSQSPLQSVLVISFATSRMFPSSPSSSSASHRCHRRCLAACCRIQFPRQLAPRLQLNNNHIRHSSQSFICLNHCEGNISKVAKAFDITDVTNLSALHSVSSAAIYDLR